MGSNIVDAPRQRLVGIRQSIIDVLLEIEEIELQVNPRIVAEYASQVGYLENDLLKWQLRARRLRRRLALVQAAVNRGETITWEQVDAVLDQEFGDWEAELSRRLSELTCRLEELNAMVPLRPSEAGELKELHRTLVKRLHPDVRPDLGDEGSRFFMIVQAAYANGDIQSLRAIATATEEMDRPLDAPSGDGDADDEDSLELDIAMAEAQLKVQGERLERLKTSRPYTLHEILDDPRALSHLQRDLERQIAGQRRAVRALEERLDDIGEVHHGR